MGQPEPILTIDSSAGEGEAYYLHLDGPQVGEASGAFMCPSELSTWQAFFAGPGAGIDRMQTDPTIATVPQVLEPLSRQTERMGSALADAHPADDAISNLLRQALCRTLQQLLTGEHNLDL